MSKRRIRLCVSIEPELAARIERLARATRQSVSRQVELLLLDAIESEEIGVKALTDPVVGRQLLKALGSAEFVQSMAKVLGSEVDEQQLKLFSDRVAGMLPAPGAEKGSKGQTKKRGKR